jgi:hypothetical protein
VRRRKLAVANPTSAEAQRDLVVSLFMLGRVTRERKPLREALDIASALERSGRLAPADHRLVDRIRQAIAAIA